MRRLHGLLLSLLLSPLFGCGEAEEAPPLGEAQLPIMNGKANGSHDEVGLLYNFVGNTQIGLRAVSECTATLIGTRAILTAAHCVLDESLQHQRPGFYRFLTGMYASGIKVTAHSFVVHPAVQRTSEKRVRADLAVGFLSEPLSNIAPAALAPFAPKKGDLITLLGYGVTGKDKQDDGTRRLATNTIEELIDDSFSFVGASGAEGNVCNGDSGGPSYGKLGSLDVLVGVHSTGTCEHTEWVVLDRSTGHDIRVDLYKDWIRQQLAQPPAPPVPQVTILEPQDQAVIEDGEVQVKYRISSKNALASVDLLVDDQVAHHDLAWSAPLLTDGSRLVSVQSPGSHRLKVKAIDLAGLEGSAEVTVQIDDPSQPPDQQVTPRDAGPEPETGAGWLSSPSGDSGCSWAPLPAPEASPVALAALALLALIRRPRPRA